MAACSGEQTKKFPASYKEGSRSVKSTLESVIFQIEAQSGKSVCLNPPASEAEIDSAEKIVNQKFSEDLRALYKIADGQNRSVECAPLFWNGYSFMSLSQMIGDWNMLKELWETQPDFAEKYPIQVGMDAAIKSNHWKLEWIPVGITGSGDRYCIDYAPTNSGVKGQIIEFIHDDTFRRLWSDDIKSFLGSIDDALRRDVASYTPSYGVSFTHRPGAISIDE